MTESDIFKAIKALVNDDTKTFEAELNKIDKESFKNIIKMENIVDIIFAKNDIESLHIFIDSCSDSYKFICETRSIKYLIDNDRWEMLVIIHHSNVFGKLEVSDMFSSQNDNTIDKFIEYGFITKSELEEEIKDISRIPASLPITKGLKKRYPEYITDKIYIDTLEDMYCHNQSMEIFRELCDMISDKYDGKNLINCNLDLEKYNILVQKVPNETIIDQIVNHVYFDFDPALIDVIGIRLRLQAHIDVMEQAQITQLHASYNIIRHSGLNFCKKILSKSMKNMDRDDTLKIFEWLPINYFTDLEKSEWFVYLRFSHYSIKLLIKLGYKMYDTPENREEFRHRQALYDQIPKY